MIIFSKDTYPFVAKKEYPLYPLCIPKRYARDNKRFVPTLFVFKIFIFYYLFLAKKKGIRIPSIPCTG